MKKSIAISVLFVLTLCSFIVLSSCAVPENQLLGRWETTIESKDLGNIKMVYHFTEEGEIFLEQKNSDAIPFSIPFGTYRVEKEKLIIISDGVEKPFTYSVKEGKLTLSYPDEADLVFMKI